MSPRKKPAITIRHKKAVELISHKKKTAKKKTAKKKGVLAPLQRRGAGSSNRTMDKLLKELGP